MQWNGTVKAEKLNECDAQADEARALLAMSWRIYFENVLYFGLTFLFLRESTTLLTSEPFFDLPDR